MYVSTFRHFASISASGSTPLFTAASMASTSSLILRGTNSRSFPACKALRQMPVLPFATPCMANASVNTSPLKPSSCLSRPCTTLRESEEGTPRAGSSAGTSRCPTIMPDNPARIAFLKGYSSTLSNRSREKGSRGSA